MTLLEEELEIKEVRDNAKISKPGGQNQQYKGLHLIPAFPGWSDREIRAGKNVGIFVVSFHRLFFSPLFSKYSYLQEVSLLSTSWKHPRILHWQMLLHGVISKGASQTGLNQEGAYLLPLHSPLIPSLFKMSQDQEPKHFFSLPEFMNWTYLSKDCKSRTFLRLQIVSGIRN